MCNQPQERLAVLHHRGYSFTTKCHADTADSLGLVACGPEPGVPQSSTISHKPQAISNQYPRTYSRAKHLLYLCLVLLVSSFAACSSDSQGFDGMLKVKSDACAAKDGTFDANAIYQCTCGGLPLGNMDVCYNHIAILTCDPENMVKECVTTYDETKKINISQWQYCRYGVWEMGEATEGDTCPVCDTTISVTCGEKSQTDTTIGVTRCIDGVWDFTPCANGCNAAADGCADCTDGTTLCEGSTLKTCQNGTYSAQICPNGCENDKCIVLDECKNGTIQCGEDGITLLTCKDGQWERSKCDNGCIDNACAASTTGCTGSQCTNDSIGTGYIKSCETSILASIAKPCSGNRSCNADGTECGECRNDNVKYIARNQCQKCQDGAWGDITECRAQGGGNQGGDGPGGSGQQRP